MVHPAKKVGPLADCPVPVLMLNALQETVPHVIGHGLLRNPIRGGSGILIDPTVGNSLNSPVR